MLRTCLSLILFISAALAQDDLMAEEDEILVERTDEAVIVRSSIAKLNFLFRLPTEFREAAVEKPWRMELRATRDAQMARIRLRVSDVTITETAQAPGKLAMARDAEYRAGYRDELTIEGEDARCVAKTGGAKGVRWVLLVRDGTRLYELFMETEPIESAFVAVFQDLADGFTILDPKGAPIAQQRTPEELKPAVIAHEYYRLKVYKPQGFTREGVDPDTDKGIFLHLRRMDEHKNMCDIKIRVYLSKTIRKSLAERAQIRGLNRFESRYDSARVPKSPRRAPFRGAKNSFRLQMAGKLRNGLVLQEDYRFVEHENDRTYEFQVTTYAGAKREFKKEIAAFWKKLKVLPK